MSRCGEICTGFFYLIDTNLRNKNVTLSPGTTEGTYRMLEGTYNELTHEVEIRVLYEGSLTSEDVLCSVTDPMLIPGTSRYGICWIINESGNTVIGYSGIYTDGTIKQRITGGGTKKIMVLIKYAI